MFTYCEYNAYDAIHYYTILIQVGGWKVIIRIYLTGMCLLLCFYCAVILYSINHICYKLLKTQLSFNGAEPTLVFNRSVFTIMSRRRYCRSVDTHIPEQRTWIIPRKVVTQRGRSRQCQYGCSRSRRRLFSEGKRLIRHETAFDPKKNG